MGRDEPTAADAGEVERWVPDTSETQRWIALAQPRRAPAEAPRRPARVFVVLAAGAVVVLLVSLVAGVLAARRLAERQAVNDAANTADLLAEAVVQPALTDAIVTGEPSAVAAVGTALADYLRTSSLVRVKIWTAGGVVVYSDEPRLVGLSFPPSPDAQQVFAHPATRAEVSDLDKPENRFERGQGRLLEAYRPVWTPSGTPLLFEIYSPYTEVDARAGQIWRGFAGVTASTVLLFAALLVPLLWQLLARLRAAQRHRERLLERAVQASEDERRRIAGTLHDGVVQELAATAFSVAGAGVRARGAGAQDVAEDLEAAAATLRHSIGGLRTLLVDIYPPTLETAGLLAVLGDLAGTLRARGVEVDLELPDADPGLGLDRDRLVFRVAHECLENVRRHSAAAHVTLRLRRVGNAAVLDVTDDGVGFDPAAVLADPPEGHLGLRVLTDLASSAGAGLAVASQPGQGCHWRLEVPLP
jgi:signal transduction histidine kinase